jgi:hypothetical protein
MSTEQDKARTFYRHVKAEVAEVGDVPGHFIGVAQSSGLTNLESGEVGAYTQYAIFDYINGSGPHQGYSSTTYEDGSATFSKFEGTTKEAGDGKSSLFEGTYTYIRGTGRFEGIEGGGTYTGKRITPFAAGADNYTDIAGTYTLP